jgi:hypothetical protein
VYACVGATGAEGGNRLGSKAGQAVLKDALNGALAGLSLPAGELGPVVVKDELNRAVGH